MFLKFRDIKHFLILSVLPVSIYSQIKLPRLISNGMVIQRNSNAKIWGWASPDENIRIQFIDSTYQAKADSNGEWSVNLKKLNAGGPYEMKFSASNIITVSDILVGDVWVCSGQSNMELPMKRVSPIYQNEIANSSNSFIRQFAVPQNYNFDFLQKDLPGGKWKSADPENVLSFSAVAYFFARTIYDKYKIPIGLINASLGGAPAEAFMSEDALKSFPQYYDEAQKFKDSSLIIKIESEDRKRIANWYEQLQLKDRGYKDSRFNWYSPKSNESGWQTMKIPGYWADTKLGSVNGSVWFRKKINIPASIAGKEARLILGRIVDADSVFINGEFIGTVSYQYPPRRYDIPPGLLKKGENIIVVRVISNIGNGGFVPDKPYEIICGRTKIDLSGNWKYRRGAEMEPLIGQTFVRWKPVGLYNAMIAPLLNYRIKGVIWYQGESNAGKPGEYADLFKTLIQDWRKNWKEGDFPFLFVQLPNFMESKKQPAESNWALMREAQAGALSLPATAMAVAIDIGEWNDIHPLNKKDVGYRLALAAGRIAYGDSETVYSGPAFQSMSIEGNKIILDFTNTGSGLTAKGKGELRSFSIAGADKKFIWAKATIKNNQVVVWNKKIRNPIAVRYAWADNPAGANLINKEGLPASPFRTDNF